MQRFNTHLPISVLRVVLQVIFGQPVPFWFSSDTWRAMMAYLFVKHVDKKNRTGGVEPHRACMCSKLAAAGLCHSVVNINKCCHLLHTLSVQLCHCVQHDMVDWAGGSIVRSIVVSRYFMGWMPSVTQRAVSKHWKTHCTDSNQLLPGFALSSFSTGLLVEWQLYNSSTNQYQ